MLVSPFPPSPLLDLFVFLLFAARRTAKYDIYTAWEALLNTTNPREIASKPQASSTISVIDERIRRLYAAQVEVRTEVDRCARSPPKFSGDGRVALVRVSSGAQIHPVISSFFSSPPLLSYLTEIYCEY